MTSFAPVRKIADAVLYEGFLLYPYTASARKNQERWQFGVVVPREYAQTGTGDYACMQTELLHEPLRDDVGVDVLVRFLHVQKRTVERFERASFEPVAGLEVGCERYVPFDETVEVEIAAAAPLGRTVTSIDIPQSVRIEALHDDTGACAGRIVRRRSALRGAIAVERENLGRIEKIRVRIENESAVAPGATRSEALRTSFVSTHTLLGSPEGRFLSLLDPPEYAASAAAACKNERTWPVLAGQSADDPRYSPLVLSSPIILYDFPQIAPSSDGDKFDGTEIDELLKLSVLSMSDAEKAEARATDRTAREIVDRAETLSSDELFALHGIVSAEPKPGMGTVEIDGTVVAKGSRVRLHPKRRADSWDVFLAGRTARVQGVHVDFEDVTYVAVTVDDDPASDLHEWYGRSLFFYPEEVEPLDRSAAETRR